MTSAEALLKLVIAVVLDSLGILCAITVIGEVVSPILDVAGFIAFGATRKRKGLAITFIAELIPFIGAIPFWTFYIIHKIITEGPFKSAA